MDLLRSLPLGLYLEQPITWLHRLDSRVKLAWLMSFLAAPILATPVWRLGLVAFLIFLTLIAPIPMRVWRQQMVLLLLVCSTIFILTCLFNDGVSVDAQPRLPASEVDFNQDYEYVLFEFGRAEITRRSVELAILTSTTIFIVLYSSNLYLLTTAPEEITDGLAYLVQPLRRLGVPVTEILLTLTLSLRFIPLVLEEIQNLVRSIRTRGINWKKLGIRQSFQIWLMVAERLIENLLMRAEQIAIAMSVRGFTSPDEHRVRWYRLRICWRDWLALAGLIVFWATRFINPQWSL